MSSAADNMGRGASLIITEIIQKMVIAFQAVDSHEERRAVMIFMECGSLSVALFQYFGLEKIDEFSSVMNYIAASAEAIARPDKTDIIA